MIIWVGEMITWVGERFKPLLARRAIVLKNEMIIWVCGTVGLWDSCGRLNDPSLARQACVPKIEMIIWVCGTVES